MTYNTSQRFESYVPVYDAVPELWDDAKPFFVEQLKKISEGVNEREIGLYLNEELLTGAQFIGNNSTPQQYRSIFRKVIDVSPLVAGANTFPHGISFTANFILIKLWVAATDPGVIAQVITDSNVTIDATNININSPGAFPVAFAFVEYTQEV